MAVVGEHAMSALAMQAVARTNAVPPTRARRLFFIGERRLREASIVFLQESPHGPMEK